LLNIIKKKQIIHYGRIILTLIAWHYRCSFSDRYYSAFSTNTLVCVCQPFVLI